jgi:predicted short-subunit dehydrogenase-like oxidoreductase (DUF2520 family)
VKISLIGAGNVAWHLSAALERAGHTIEEVYSRQKTNAERLANRLRCAQATDDLDLRTSKAQLFLLCVADDAYELVLSRLQLPQNTLIAHTSGSLPLAILAAKQRPAGVFYPLQTFSKQKTVDFTQVLFCIEGQTPEAEKQLQLLAQALSQQVKLVSSEQRRVLHLAAVFACNFTNYMLSLADEILTEKGASLQLLTALIQETIQKALLDSPHTAQTGPARRGDLQLIEKHLETLQQKPEAAQVYRLLSELIVDKYRAK